MERLPGGRRLRLASSLGLGQRCWEVTLDEERGLLAWRDPRPPRRGAAAAVVWITAVIFTLEMEELRQRKRGTK